MWEKIVPMYGEFKIIFICFKMGILGCLISKRPIALVLSNYMEMVFSG